MGIEGIDVVADKLLVVEGGERGQFEHVLLKGEVIAAKTAEHVKGKAA